MFNNSVPDFHTVITDSGGLFFSPSLGVPRLHPFLSSQKGCNLMYSQRKADSRARRKILGITDINENYEGWLNRERPATIHMEATFHTKVKYPKHFTKEFSTSWNAVGQRCQPMFLWPYKIARSKRQYILLHPPVPGCLFAAHISKEKIAPKCFPIDLRQDGYFGFCSSGWIINTVFLS